MDARARARNYLDDLAMMRRSGRQGRDDRHPGGFARAAATDVLLVVLDEYLVDAAKIVQSFTDVNQSHAGLWKSA